MTDKEAAQKILRLSEVAIFSIEEASSAAGCKPTAIRNWISRGHINLRYTMQQGRGSRTFFAFNDILQIMVVAELSRLEIDPQIGREFSAGIMATTMHRIAQIANVFGDTEAPSIFANVDRYAILFYNPHTKEIDSLLWHEPVPEAQFLDAARIVIDCSEMASKAIAAIKSFTTR